MFGRHQCRHIGVLCRDGTPTRARAWITTGLKAEPPLEGGIWATGEEISCVGDVVVVGRRQSVCLPKRCGVKSGLK